MVQGEIDIRELERSLVRVASAFGEANETGISRWGVGVCRGLVKETQAWGDSSKIGDPKKKQQQAMMKDGRRAFVVIKDPLLVKKLNQKKLDGIQTSKLGGGGEGGGGEGRGGRGGDGGGKHLSPQSLQSVPNGQKFVFGRVPGPPSSQMLSRP